MGNGMKCRGHFTQVAGSRKIDFFIIVLQGEGEVFFDNISAASSKEKPWAFTNQPIRLKF